MVAVEFAVQVGTQYAHEVGHNITLDVSMGLSCAERTDQGNAITETLIPKFSTAGITLVSGRIVAANHAWLTWQSSLANRDTLFQLLGEV